MKRVFIGITMCCLSAWASVGSAYEPGTHGKMTDFAAQQSVLVSTPADMATTVLQDLDLSNYAEAGQTFTDIQNGEKVDLGPDGTDPFAATTPLTVQQLVITGAQLEDESGLITGRPLNHFFDPTTGSPLNYAFLGKIYTSKYNAPAWAASSHCAGSSSTGLYNPSGDSASDTNQCFSLQDGISYFYNALTAPKAVDRNEQFGNLFLTLGHVMHLVQDMAQPQHVRNDPHCDIWECHLVGKYNASRYETISYGPAGPNIQNFAGAYGQVKLPDARSFWATDQSTLDHRGLAEYTNRNFFSAGSLGLYGGVGSSYAAPTANGQITTETIQEVLAELGPGSNADIDAACPATAPCYVSFIATTVDDKYKGINTVVNAKAAAVSLFSGDLVNKGDAETFSLNDATYRAAWQFLIPAAIDYSTGLVNYVFRGRLGVRPDPSNPGSYLVQNLSSYPMQGTVEFYYDDAQGNRYPIPSSQTAVSLAAFTSGTPPAQQSVIVNLPPGPAPAKPGKYMVVFNGTIGTEAGIAGKIYDYNDDDFLVNVGNQLNGEDFIQEFNSTGAMINQFDSGFSNGTEGASAQDGATGVAVYGNSRYAGSTYRLSLNGNVFKMYDANTIAFIGPLAVDTSHLFTVVTPIANVPVYIDAYDHNGGQETQFLTTTLSAVTGFSANGTRLCVSGLDMNSNGAAFLEDYQGNVIASLAANASWGGQVCASTSDRHYLVYWDGSSITLYVYDNAGNQITSLPVSGADFGDALGIAANDHYIYVSNVNFPGNFPTGKTSIAVFQRVLTSNPDGSTSENFVRQPDITTPGASYDDAADMLPVLTQGGP